MSSAQSIDVTQILLEWRSGNEEALNRLMPLVYDELRRLALRYMRGERPEHTLQATALVNETYLRLVDMKVSWQDRAHFFAVAARLMRRLLVDHARAQQRAKRDSGGQKKLLNCTSSADSAMKRWLKCLGSIARQCNATCGSRKPG